MQYHIDYIYRLELGWNRDNIVPGTVCQGFFSRKQFVMNKLLKKSEGALITCSLLTKSGEKEGGWRYDNYIERWLIKGILTTDECL